MDLPIELDRKILELAARANPSGIVVLMVLSREVKTWYVQRVLPA